MGDRQEANTDIMDGGPEPDSEGECDSEQETDTDIMDDGGPEPHCVGRRGDVPGRIAYTLGDGQPVDSCSNVQYVEDNMQVECICKNNGTPIAKHTAIQTQNQNVDRPAETNQRII